MADAIVTHCDRLLVTRAEARAAGLKRYFTGKPCKRGHVAERCAAKKRCVECHREESKAYASDNHQKVREQASRHYSKNKESIKTKSSEWRLANPERKKANNCKHYQENKEQYRTNNAQWKNKNPERVREINRKWEQAHPEECRAKVRNRRARIRQAEGSHTAEEVADLLVKQKYRCAHKWCGASLRKGYHADHIEALANGGSNWIWNIQLLCAPCNQKKHAKDPIEWAQQNGMLL